MNSFYIIEKNKFYILFYLFFSIIGFITLGEPGLTGEISIQTYSDSLTWENLAREHYESVKLFEVHSNKIFPVFVIRLFNYNYMAIYMMNLLLLFISFKIIFSYYNINKNIFLFFIFFSPLIYFSLFNINKEMIVIFETALFLAYLKNRSITLFIIIIITSFFIRWQLSLFFLLIFVVIIIDRYYSKRWVILFLFLITLSITYPLMSFIFQRVIDHGAIDKDLVQGSGIFDLLKKIQSYPGGYIFAFFPKLMQGNFGLVKRVDMLFYFEDFWNYFVLLLHSAMSLILTIYLIYKKRFTLNNILVYAAMIFGILFTLSPIINVRYFLPMYIIFAVVASQYNYKIREANENITHN